MAFDTFDTDSVSTAGMTFTNGNLTAQGSGSSINTSDVAQSIEGKTSGKWYVEFTCVAVSGHIDGVGVINSWGLMSNPFGFVGGSGTSAIEIGWGYYTNNHVVVKNTTQSSVNNTTWGAGDVIGLAIDLDNKRVWWRKNTGNWVGTSGTPDPATNTSGFDISNSLNGKTRIYPCANISGSSGKFTANFGATSFTGTVPSGFNSGWTNTTAGTYFGTFACTGRGVGASVSAPPLGNKAVSPYVSNFTAPLDHFIIALAQTATDIKGVVYDATGTGGLPGALLGVSTNTITSSSLGGEITLNFSGVNLVNGTTYWFGVVSDVSPISQNTALGPPLTNGIVFNSGTYASPTNPFGASPSTANFRYPILVFPVPNINVNVTGVSGAGSAAATIPEIDKSLAGVSGAGAANATTASVSAILTGVSAAGAANAVTVTYSGTVNLTGVSASGAAGTTTETFDYAVNAVGAAATGAANPVSLVYDSNVPVTGVSGAAHAAAVTPVAVSPTIVLPVFSIMRDVPVAANGNMADIPVATNGTMTNVLPIFSLMRNTAVATSGSMSNTPVAVTGSLFAA